MNKSYCLTCKTGYFYDNVRKGCRNDSKCDGNNFFSNGTCLRCNKNCLACHGVSSNCTSCVDFYNKNKLFMVNDTGTCLSDCPAHYFGEIQYIINTTTILNYMCKACDVNCLTCKDSLVSSCLSCNTSEKTTKYLQYGTCISNCIDNFILTDPSTCRQNCSTVTKCYKCSTNNDSQCLSCISPYDILLKDECYSEEQICNNSHQFISSNNPTTCSECDSTCRTCKKSSKNCLSCYNQSIYFQFLYNDKCVMNCPAGYSPDYGDNMSCKDFICDNPCEKCLHNQSTCYECNNNTPYFFENYCFEKCPDKTSYNAILKVCVTSEKQKSEIWASWIVFSVFVMLTGFFIFSLFFSRNIINFESSVICLMQIAEFLSKILIFGFLFSFQEMAACVFSFISIVNNSLLSMMFQTLHIGVLEIHIRSFALFKSSNKKFYYFVLAGMLVFGINFTFAFSSGLFKFVKNEFETNFTYAKGLNRMVFFGFIFALMQLGVDCFVLSKYDNIEYDVFHLAYMNLIMNSVIYLIWGLQKIRAIIENLKKKIR